MKKLAFFAAVAVLAIACQEKVDPVVPPEINFANPDLVIPYQGSEDESLKIEFKANVDWTAELDNTYDWLQLLQKSGSAGDASITVVASKNTSKEVRGATVTVTAGISVLQFSIMQEGVPYVSVAQNEVVFGVDGGSEEISISANAKYVFNNTDEDWLSCTIDSKNGVLKINVDKNASYSGRSTSVSFVNNLEGISETIAISQEGRSKILWQKTYSADLSAITLGATNRLVVKGDYLLVAAGANAVHVLNKTTGEYVNQLTLPAGADVSNMTSDDAGNIIIGADVAFEASAEVYYVSDLSTLTPVKLLTVSGDIYGTGQSNIRVVGDVTKNAAMTMIVGGAPTYGGSFYWVGWDIKDGKVGERQYGEIPSESGEDMWSNQQGCVHPLGTSLSQGLVATWYPTESIKYSLNPTSDAPSWESIPFEDFVNGCNCAIDINTFGGKNYLFVGVGSHWNYSPSGFYMIDVTNISSPEVAFSYSTGYIDVNGKGAAADITTEVVGNKMNIYFTDNNKDAIVAVEIQ